MSEEKKVEQDERWAFSAIHEFLGIASKRLYPTPDKPNSDWAKLRAAVDALALLEASAASTSANVEQGAEAVRDSCGEQVRLMEWRGGAGLLWDVYAFGKWSKRIVSPIEWDAHTVYLDMVRAGYAKHIEIRLVSSSNNAYHDEPLTDAEGKRLPSLEEIQNLRDHGHFEEAAWRLERRNATLTAAQSASGDKS